MNMDGDKQQLQIQEQPDTATLLRELVADARELLRQEFRLAVAEGREDLARGVQALSVASVGIAFALTSVIMMAFALAHLPMWDQVAVWGRYGIVGLALLALGIGAMLFSRHRARQIDAVSVFLRMKRDAKWIAKETKSNVK